MYTYRVLCTVYHCYCVKGKYNLAICPKATAFYAKSHKIYTLSIFAAVSSAISII
jgi:hypothetical protein